ncbi:zinc-finger of the MIZ type in Nse subunit-domain-containing protein [Coemansia spiralis]|nr:zinc-finger of the MIZ type in Nse subunit-domain-containing protein [Coemansia spiralis]
MSFSQTYTRSQGANGNSESSNGAQIQLQGRLLGIKNNIQAANEIIDQAVQSCTVAALDLEEMDDPEKVDDIDVAFRSLLDSQHQLELEQSLLSKAATHQDPETAAAEYSSARDEMLAKYSKLSDSHKYGNNQQYCEFRQQLWDLKHEGEPMPNLFGPAEEGNEDEDDLVIAGARLTYKCPITASWLTDPVTSKVCKHSFSRDAIVDYIRGHHGSCPCPVGGCSHRIQLRDLHQDKVLERKVANHLRKLEAEESSAAYTFVQ